MEQAEQLQAERVRVAAQLAELVDELDGIIAAAQDVALDDEHDPDGATVGFERARAAALVERTRQRLAALDDALARLEHGTYGMCASCGAPIPAERLAALPDAVACVACAGGGGVRPGAVARNPTP